MPGPDATVFELDDDGVGFLHSSLDYVGDRDVFHIAFGIDTSATIWLTADSLDLDTYLIRGARGSRAEMVRTLARAPRTPQAKDSLLQKGIWATESLVSSIG